MSAALRKQRSLTRRLQEGGSLLSIVLNAEETAALASGMAKAGATVKREYVARLILQHQ